MSIPGGGHRSASEALLLSSFRLQLQLIGRDEARRIVSAAPLATDRWHPQYPLEDELVVLQELADSDEQDAVFGLYLIRTLADGLAVGGIGFFGQPDGQGSVEVGYGLVEAVRGRGLATEALGVAVRIAGNNGAKRMKAETAVGNVASQRVLQKAGFRQVSHSADVLYYDKRLISAIRPRRKTGMAEHTGPCSTYHESDPVGIAGSGEAGVAGGTLRTQPIL